MRRNPKKARFVATACYLGVGAYLLIAWLTPLIGASTSHIERSVELMRQGNLEGAEQAARLALSSPSTRPVAYAALGAIRLQQQRYDESSDFLTKAIELDPHLIGARLSLGQVYVFQGKLEDAEQAYQRVLELDPDNGPARVALTETAAQRGNYRLSSETAQPILAELRRSPEGLLLLATDYLGVRDQAAAKGLVPAWRELPEPPLPATVRFALLLSRNGLSDEPIGILEDNKRAGRVSYASAFNLAGLYLLKRDFQLASNNYELALSLKEDSVPALRQIAQIAEQAGEYEKALSFLIRAKKAEPENPDVLLAFGRVCLKFDLVDDANKALEKAVEIRPDHDASLYVLASARVGAGRREEARLLLERLVKKTPQDAQLNFALGAVLHLETKLEEAATYLEKSIELKPNQASSYYYLGLVVQNQGDNSRAIELFRRVIEGYPDHALSYEGLGTALLRDREYDEARRMLERAIELNPKSVKANYQLGLVLRRVGKKDEAKKQLMIAKELREEVAAETRLQLHLLNPH